jgi:cobalt/nickel transport system permease protein
MERLTGHYRNEHFLAKVDARVKLLSGLVLLVMVLSYRGYAFPLLVALMCLGLCVRMRVPLRLFVLRFSEPAFIALMAVLLKFFFTGKDVLFSVQVFGMGITGYRDGLMEGLLLASRIAGAVSIVAVMGFATPFAETMAALSWLRVPRGLIEVLMLAYRYIFVLLEDAVVIYNAQKNRLGYSSVRRGLRSFGILAGSLVLKALEQSQHTATALAQRGYDGDFPKLGHGPVRLREAAAAAVFLLVLGTVWTLA